MLLADGGDCLSDLATLRDQPELFGSVASTRDRLAGVEQVAPGRARPGCPASGRRPVAAAGLAGQAVREVIE